MLYNNDHLANNLGSFSDLIKNKLSGLSLSGSTPDNVLTVWGKECLCRTEFQIII